MWAICRGFNAFQESRFTKFTGKKLPLCDCLAIKHLYADNKRDICRRSLRIVAESYAIKGLCLQKESSATSKFKKAERGEDIIKCFDLASDLSLLYMQKLEREIITTTVPNTGKK